MPDNEPNQIQSFTEKFKKAKKDAEMFLQPLDERTFRRKPSSDKWCIGECFSHLVETGSKYFHQVEKGFKDAVSSEITPSDPMHLRFHMRWFVNYLAPPITFKSKSPGSFKPVDYAGLDKDLITRDYLQLQDRFIEKLEYAAQKKVDLSSIKVSNPVISWLGMTIAECIAATEAHQRRHLEQARYILKLVAGDKEETL